MRNQAAWILFAALLIVCAAMLGGCSAHDESDAAQSAPDLSVNISVPYATTTPTAVPEDPDQPFSFDANGRVTVLNERWIDEGFVSATSDDEEQTGGYTQLRLGDQGQRVQQLQMRLREFAQAHLQLLHALALIAEAQLRIAARLLLVVARGGDKALVDPALVEYRHPAVGVEGEGLIRVLGHGGGRGGGIGDGDVDREVRRGLRRIALIVRAAPAEHRRADDQKRGEQYPGGLVAHKRTSRKNFVWLLDGDSPALVHASGCLRRRRTMVSSAPLNAAMSSELSVRVQSNRLSQRSR